MVGSSSFVKNLAKLNSNEKNLQFLSVKSLVNKISTISGAEKQTVTYGLVGRGITLAKSG